MALLTKHYRQAAYILAAIQEEKRAGAGGRMAKLEATTKDLISGLEDVFKSKSSIEELQQYLEVGAQEVQCRTAETCTRSLKAASVLL
jgi:flagellar motor switch protein FliG